MYLIHSYMSVYNALHNLKRKAMSVWSIGITTYTCSTGSVFPSIKLCWMANWRSWSSSSLSRSWWISPVWSTTEWSADNTPQTIHKLLATLLWKVEPDYQSTGTLWFITEYLSFVIDLTNICLIQWLVWK